MSETLPLFVLHVLGFAGFLWLGLYALAHGDRGRVATLTGLTALATACFFCLGGLLIALHGAPATATVQRVMWWADVLPVALWLHLSLSLNPRAPGTRRPLPALGAIYGAALLLTLLGSFTGLINNYSTIPVTAGPAYALYAAYLFAGTGVALVNLARLWLGTRPNRAPVGAWQITAKGPAAAVGGPANGLMAVVEPAGVVATTGTAETAVEAPGMEARLLVAGALFFLLGGGYLVVKLLLRSSWPELPAYILLLAGLGAVGATVAVRSALMLGTDVRRAALYSFTGLAALLALYLLAAGLLIGFNGVGQGIFALVLVALITSSHTLHDVLRAWLDTIFFSPPVRRERAAARAYASELATQPAGAHPELATPKAFDDAVRRALTHLSDPTKLAASPLLNLSVVARGISEQQLEDNRLNRAAVLKEMLLDLLEGLRPHDGAGRVTGGAWRYYNCLYYPYVRGIGRRRAPTVLRRLSERRQREGGPRGDLEQVLEWLLQVDEDTFYKWQRRGSDTIAAALREREASVSHSLPAPALSVARS